LTRLEIEILGRHFVHELQAKGLHRWGFFGDFGDAHQVGQVDVFFGHLGTIRNKKLSTDEHR